MDKKSEPKNDKFITGKMISYIGDEFDVFLGKNMSIFICGKSIKICLPYTGDINSGFLENNHGELKDGPLYSFFMEKKSKILSLDNGEITLNFINKDKKSLKNTEILILHPWNEIAKKLIQTTIDGKILKITNTTTIADIFKQLKIQNLMPNEIKQPNHKSTDQLNKEVLIKKKIEQTNNKTDNIKNNIEKTIKSTKPNKEVTIQKEIEQTNNKTENVANDIKETNEPANNTSNSLFDEKCCCGFSLNDIKNNLCSCL